MIASKYMHGDMEQYSDFGLEGDDDIHSWCLVRNLYDTIALLNKICMTKKAKKRLQLFWDVGRSIHSFQRIQCGGRRSDSF